MSSPAPLSVHAPEPPHDAEALFRALIEAAPEAVVAMDARGDVIVWNPEAERVFGWTREEAIGRPLPIVPPEGMEEHRRFREQVLERGEAFTRMEVVRRRKDGSLVPISLSTAPMRDARGAIVGVVSFSIDVTERKAAEQANRRLAAIVESSSDAIVSTSLDGTIQSWNAAAERIYGYSAREVLGRSISLLVPPELASEEASTVFRLARGERIEGHETVRLRKDGRRIYVSLTVSPIRDDAGEIASVSSIARDITEAKQVEAELRESEAALRRAKEAAEAASRSKSEFLSGMSHELRTPLNSVIGFTNVLRKNKAGTLRPQELGYLERIHANGMHLLGLINDVLDLSKIEAGKMRVELLPVPLDELIRETLEELQGGVPRCVELRAELPDGGAELETDARKLKQILINLVGNALKFTESGSVTARLVLDPETRRPSRIDIVDTGVGIPEERLRAIFDAFEQAEAGTARRFGGTGLGLTISASLAGLLGYRISVSSELGHGSTFSVLLDAPAERAAPPARTSEHPTLEEILGDTESGEFANRLVMIVDDDPDARFVLSVAIAEHGCEILTASSGEQAIELARQVRPDLITLDLIMPGGMSGWETLRALKADPELSEIPVVVISVLTEESRTGTGGAVDLLRKPPTRADLEGVLRRSLGERPGRVLVVDDDEEMRVLIAAVVQSQEEQAEVRTAADGAEAVRLIRTFAPDLVFIDLSMPELDGLQTLSRLRSERPGLDPVVVVVTGRPMDADELDRLRGEVGAVVHKDADLEASLRREMRDTWRRAR